MSNPTDPNEIDWGLLNRRWLAERLHRVIILMVTSAAFGYLLCLVVNR